VEFGTDVITSGLVEMKSPVKWMKVQVTAGTGNVSAYIQGCP
jgi:proline racemase